MSEAKTLAAQVARIHADDPWYGDPIATVLDGIAPNDAGAHPIPGAHSIWELVLHLTSWVHEVERRLKSGTWRQPVDGDWPAVPEPTAANWQAAVARLGDAHGALATTVAGLSPKQLDEEIGQERDRALGTGVTFRETIHGILQHDAYHLGQISLLKRALGSR